MHVSVSGGTRRSNGCCVEIGNLLLDPHDVGVHLRLHEPGRSYCLLPLLRREETAARSVEGMEARRPERLQEIEDEFRIDRVARIWTHALRHDEAAAGLERPS